MLLLLLLLLLLSSSSSLLLFDSQHHQDFDPFQEQKEESFKGLQNSAISLAQFLDHSLHNSGVDDEEKRKVKNAFDTLLQVKAKDVPVH